MHCIEDDADSQKRGDAAVDSEPHGGCRMKRMEVEKGVWSVYARSEKSKIVGGI